MKSQRTKVMVYVLGRKREISSPYTTTIRAKQRYIAELRKAGPMVKQIRYLDPAVNKAQQLERRRALFDIQEKRALSERVRMHLDSSDIS